MEETTTKPKQIPERKELHTQETAKTKWVLERKAACVQSKTNPMGQVILLLQLYLDF